MTIAMDIISGRMPDFIAYLHAGESLDDIDEYGFTPLIEAVIARNREIVRALLQQKINVNKPDLGGRTSLQWAVDNNDAELTELLMAHGADVNAFTPQGFSALVYPLLRSESKIKQLLLKQGANLNFAQDFILAKLIGHRFSLKGTVDIVTPNKNMMEVDYEGFVLEFTSAVLQNSLERFLNSYASRRWRDDFYLLKQIVRGFENANQILLWQRQLTPNQRFHEQLSKLAEEPFLILPAASSGHAMGFIVYQDWLAKIDRGENSKKEGSVNVYRIGRRDKIDAYFLDDFLFKKQNRAFFHQRILRILDLEKIATYPIQGQVVGNCSWANMEACVGIGHLMLSIYPNIHLEPSRSGYLYQSWLNWDKDRAIEELLESFKGADKYRKASIASMLCGVLFQNLDAYLARDTYRAEKILKVVVEPDYLYILQSYLDVYCPVSQKTQHGENLLRLLDNCGYDSERLGVKSS